MEAKCWRTLIWDLSGSSENFSFKELSWGFLEWSKETLPVVVWSCYWLSQPSSSYGAVSPARKVDTTWLVIWVHDSLWFPHHRAVTRCITASCKRVTSVQACDSRRAMLAQHLWIVFKASFSLFYLIVNICIDWKVWGWEQAVL